MVIVSEEADCRKVRVFRWNEKLRKNGVSDCKALFLFRISDKFITIRYQRQFFNEGISQKVVIFDRTKLLSDNFIKSLTVDALNSTNQFLPNTVLSLAHQISTSLISQYRFSPQNLLRRNLPRIVIVVDVDRSRTVNYGFRTTHPIPSPLCPSSYTQCSSDSSDDELDEEFHTMAAQDTCEDPIYNWDEDTDLKQIMGKLVSLPQKLGERGKYPLEPIDTDEPVGFFEVDPEKDHVWKPTKDDRSTAVGLCPICLDVMSTDTMDIIYETCCFHVFHWRCMLAWLPKSNSCPTCRSQLS